MFYQSDLKKIEDDKKLNIQKTMDHPINEALKWWELKDAIISSQEKWTNVLSPNQISVSLDKYENRIIKKKKI